MSLTSGEPRTVMAGLLESRRKAREREARRRAASVLRALRAMGVRAKVFGSLAEGPFRLHSDADFLVLRCPHEKKYTLEGVVEELMGDIPFDVVYQDERRGGQ